MSGVSKYKWLMVVEGSTDVKTYGKLLSTYGVNCSDFYLISACGKGIGSVDVIAN